MLNIHFLGTATSSGMPVIGCRCPRCASTDPRNQRYRASLLMKWNGANVIIDTGPEFRLQVIRAGIDRLDAVLYTHEHADHIYGLDDVRMFPDHSAPLPVFCFPRTADAIERVFPYVFGRATVAATSRPSISLNRIDGAFDIGGETVTPVPVWHGPTAILGYRVRDFAYITDCSEIPPKSMELLSGLGTLVLGALRHEPHPTHYTVAQALEVITQIRPRRAFLTHIGHDLDHEETSASLPPGVEMAYDALEFEVE
jgi:phosphoribosyl 1,2-cyclic phosphate phosphodiesterase